MLRIADVNERGNLIVASIVLAGGLLLGGCDTSKSAPPPPSVPEVATVTVQTEQVVLTTELPGRTSAYSMAEIRPQVGGIIQKRLFEEGSEIKGGQVLYQIDPAPLQAAYDNAAANLAAARKAADRARAGLAGSRTGVVRQRAVVENARVNRKRFEDLVAEGAVSASQRDQAVADADVADATLLTTEAQVESDREAVGAAEAAIQQAEADIGLPTNVRGSFQGTAKGFADTLKQEPVLILAALTAIYLVLGILYESLVHPITVLSTLPSAGVGALLALMIFKMEFSIIALIGIFLLIGLVKKNAIMIIDFALDAQRSGDLSAAEAVREACLLRFRPILMTTLAAGLGALPLAVGFGEGSELRRPLGIAIVGGLIASQLLTLLTTPVVYVYIDRLRRRRDERFLSRPGGQGQVQPA